MAGGRSAARRDLARPRPPSERSGPNGQDDAGAARVLGVGWAELAVLGAAEERIPLGPREDQRWALGMPGITHRDLTTGEEGNLHAVAAGGAAATAPYPPSVGQGARVHAVTDAAHGDRSNPRAVHGLFPWIPLVARSWRSACP